MRSCVVSDAPTEVIAGLMHQLEVRAGRFAPFGEKGSRKGQLAQPLKIWAGAHRIDCTVQDKQLSNSVRSLEFTACNITLKVLQSHNGVSHIFRLYLTVQGRVISRTITVPNVQRMAEAIAEATAHFCDRVRQFFGQLEVTFFQPGASAASVGA